MRFHLPVLVASTTQTLKGEFQVFVQLNAGPFAADNSKPSTIKL